MTAKAISQIEARFMARVERDVPATGCWEWSGGRDRDGYGHFSLGGRTYRAHRWSFAHFVGPIPPELIVRHRCDNPSCVNPKHLELGSLRDNAQDMGRRGRRGDRRGLNHPLAKLSEDQVRGIRALAAAGCRRGALAATFGVSRTHINRIVWREKWGHL